MVGSLTDAEKERLITYGQLANKETIVEGGDPLSKYEHDIRRFMDAMKYKLRKNAHKGRWEDLDFPQAMKLMIGEMNELEDAIKDGNMVEIMLEAADVANFALMVAAIAMERGR